MMAGAGVNPGARDPEAEALMRLANVIEAELPAITSEDWHEALAGIRRRLADSAQRRMPRASLQVHPGGEA